MRVRTTNPHSASLYRDPAGVDLSTAMYMVTDCNSDTVNRAIEFLVEHRVLPIALILGPDWVEVTDGPADPESP